MIQKLICCECQTELKFKLATIDNETLKQEYYCPRCKKCVEVWLI